MLSQRHWEASPHGHAYHRGRLFRARAEAITGGGTEDTVCGASPSHFSPGFLTSATKHGTLSYTLQTFIVLELLEVRFMATFYVAGNAI